MIEWYYLVAISSAIMGVSTIVEKYALKTQHATSFSASFSILIAGISLIFLLFAKFNISVYNIGIIYALSLVSSSTYLLTARIYKHSNISVSTPLFSSLPQMFVVIMAFIFLKERLSILQYISLAALIALAYLLLFSGKKLKSKTFESKKYVYLLLMTTFLVAVGGIIMKYLLNIGVNVFEMFILLQIFIALNMSTYITLKYGGIREEISNIKNNWPALLSVALLTAGYRITYYISLNLAYISLASPLRNSISVMITVLIGGLLFKEGNIYRKLLIAIAMVFIVYVLVAN
ncbi:EamA family transporter [Candidatus Marsarchaeota archaeon]|nr:EamA family transporter [Candidatus Marsarchaeota archaeon]MCL5404912.1 EamA family transporter [Candidatus Marsarchaeota archaeon]